MLINHVEIRDTDAPIIETNEEVEEIELEQSLDPRLDGLSDKTRHVIMEAFGGDVDEAEYQATKYCNTFARPYEWCKELVGFTKGWRDNNRARC